MELVPGRDTTDHHTSVGQKEPNTDPRERTPFTILYKYNPFHWIPKKISKNDGQTDSQYELGPFLSALKEATELGCLFPPYQGTRPFRGANWRLAANWCV